MAAAAAAVTRDRLVSGSGTLLLISATAVTVTAGSNDESLLLRAVDTIVFLLLSVADVASLRFLFLSPARLTIAAVSRSSPLSAAVEVEEVDEEEEHDTAVLEAPQVLEAEDAADDDTRRLVL